MEKNLSALGFMSGTSGDGVDTSVISSNGKDTINIRYNRFDPYPKSLSKKIHRVKESISKMQDLLKYSSEIDKLELEILIFTLILQLRQPKRLIMTLSVFMVTLFIIIQRKKFQNKLDLVLIYQN